MIDKYLKTIEEFIEFVELIEFMELIEFVELWSWGVNLVIQIK